MSDSHRQAYSLAYRLTGNASEAEDLVQEAYLRAYRFFRRYDRSLPFTSWLYRIITNVHIDLMRRKGKLQTTSLDSGGVDGNTTWEIADPCDSPAKVTVDQILDSHLQLGLKAMTPEFRAAVVLADIEGMAYEDVAEVMGTSIGTVRSRIHRGRKQLREYLKSYFPKEYEEVSR
jgi:RNA polymerase sigma-70 factor (ECF subfamily)